MSAVIKGAIAFGSLAGAGGLGYGIYNAVRTPTYTEALKDTLLNTEGEAHKNSWGERLKSLRAVEPATKLVENLRTLKTETQTDNLWTKLRDWCKDIINNSKKEETDNEFQNVQNYCTFSIKEKLKNIIVKKTGGADENADWAVGHTALKKIPNDQLDQKLIEAKGKTVAKEANKAVKDWCDEWLDKPFKGKENQQFKNASKICVTS